uniref:Uncharacterized protein n=1 Tax=Ananas comosus var. bracteatus TaxID=296719 RepID=A0A6V7NVX6_ANACO|nr:unnamed protein product [Ananas comosus var. bracteatus]
MSSPLRSPLPEEELPSPRFLAAAADADAEPHHPDLSSAAPRGGGDRAPRRAPRPAAAAAAASRRRRRLVRVDRWPRRRGGAPAVAVAVAGGLGDRAAWPPRCRAAARGGCGSRGGGAPLPLGLLRPRRRPAQGLGPRLLQQLQPIPVLRGGERDRVPVRRVPGVLTGDADEEGEARHRPPAGHYFDFAMDQVWHTFWSLHRRRQQLVLGLGLHWGTDPFPSMANGSIAVSFLAFLAFALSSLISAYNLFCPDL